MPINQQVKTLMERTKHHCLMQPQWYHCKMHSFQSQGMLHSSEMMHNLKVMWSLHSLKHSLEVMLRSLQRMHSSEMILSNLQVMHSPKVMHSLKVMLQVMNSNSQSKLERPEICRLSKHPLLWQGYNLRTSRFN